MICDDYTSPEISTERGLARRQVAKVTAAGGCAYCLHRVEGWNRVACDQPHRTFPRCISTPGLGFEPDHQKLQGEYHAPD